MNLNLIKGWTTEWTDEYYSDIPDCFLQDKMVLDVGAGYGMHQTRSRHKELLQHASQNGLYLGIEIELLQEPLLHIIEADIRDVPLHSTVDTILIMHCIEHIPLEDWNSVFDRLKNILRPGGWMIVAAPFNEKAHRSCSPAHVVFDINDIMLAEYLPGVQMFKSSKTYPNTFGIKNLIWWFRRFINGDRVVPFTLTRHSFIAFWRKIEEGSTD